jgi:hypothetical protein
MLNITDLTLEIETLVSTKLTCQNRSPELIYELKILFPRKIAHCLLRPCICLYAQEA